MAETKKDTFMQLPMSLWNSELSRDAVCLGTFLLNRCKLSELNDLRDEKGIYVFCTIDTAAKELRCSKATASKIFNELEKNGFITKASQGVGKATRYYLNYGSEVKTMNSSAPKSQAETAATQNTYTSSKPTQKEPKPSYSYRERYDPNRGLSSSFDLSDIEKLLEHSPQIIK